LKKVTIALAGNPNAGKTTIFNALTGGRQHVGNYPGVTVEKKEGRLQLADYEITLVDLPGTYSLTAYSPDEVVARNVLLAGDVDLIISIVDASNASRSLNLTVQLMELGIPMVLALNMLDVAESKGSNFDFPLLSQLMGMPAVPVVGTKNLGFDQLLAAVLEMLDGRGKFSRRILRYEREIETAISEIESQLPEELANRRWLAVKLLEDDREVKLRLGKQLQNDAVFSTVQKSRDQLTRFFSRDPEMVIVENRFAFVRGALRESERFVPLPGLTWTEKLDQVILNRVLGLPIFFLIMWALFQFTFTLGQYPGVWISSLFEYLGAFFSGILPSGLLRSLVVDGMIGGVGGVLVFLPNIVLLYLGITFLEATGYMSRAAFVVDRLMHKMGLHGKSFIPMMLGFGCSIPAVMATRTLENPRDRLATILVIPLMSCGARLPVYTLLAGAFFPAHMAGSVVFAVYLVGIILAVVIAKLLRGTLLSGASEPFVMELPEYRMPMIRNMIIQVGERAWLYLKKAGTVILAASILLWAMFTFPVQQTSADAPMIPAQLEASLAGMAGRGLEPALQPLGLDWRSGIALLSGLAAKEVIVSTMGTLYSIQSEEAATDPESASFSGQIRQYSGFTPLTAFVFMLFILIYIPCLSTLAVVQRETNSWRWPAFMAAYTLSLAWLVSFITYRVGLVLGLG